MGFSKHSMMQKTAVVIIAINWKIKYSGSFLRYVTKGS